MRPKDLENYYDRLKKKGQAKFKIIFKASPDDDGFSYDDPLANVTVIAKNPTTGVTTTRFSEMSTKACEFDVEITILNIAGVFRRFWGWINREKKPNPYQVTITVEPHPDWKDKYSSKQFSLEVQTGTNPPQHVWMVPTKDKKD